MNSYLRVWTLYTNGGKTCSQTADGASQTYSSPAINDSRQYLKDTLIATQYFTVYHNSDGNKSCVLSGYYAFIGTYGGKSINGISASATVTLDYIPRTSSFSGPGSASIGSGVWFNISRASSGFVHQLYYRYVNDGG